MRKITFLLFFTLNFLTAQQTYEFTLYFPLFLLHRQINQAFR
jgi:hypothetical protein